MKTSLLGIAAVIAMLGAMPASETKANPASVVARYQEAHNTRDIRKMMSVYDRNVIATRSGSGGWSNYDQLEEHWKELFATSKTLHIEITLNTTLPLSQDSATMTGTYVGTYDDAQGLHHVKGRFLNVVIRERDGSWRIIRNCSFTY